MIIQLQPPIPITCPKGNALAHFLIDPGPESHLQWVCFLDQSGECWTFQNPDIRAQKNITQGRDYISPFYEPHDTSLKKQIELDPFDISKTIADGTIDEIVATLKNLKEKGYRKLYYDGYNATVEAIE